MLHKIFLSDILGLKTNNFYPSFTDIFETKIDKFLYVLLQFRPLR